MSKPKPIRSYIPLAGYCELYKKSEPKKEEIELQEIKPQQPQSSQKHKEIQNYLLSLCVVVKPGDDTEEIVGHENVLITVVKSFAIDEKLELENSSQKSGLPAVLLAGIPGTGKSTVLKAAAGVVANTMNKPVSTWSVSASTILSKYQGESEASLRMLYKLASENGPSIVSVDEVDGLMGGTGRDNEDELARRFKTEFLQVMQGTSVFSNVLTIGCTNRPWLLKDNFSRRFPYKFLIELPSGVQRILILKKALKIKAGIDYSTLGFSDKDVVSATKGFTGDQIFRAVIATVLHVTSFQKNGENVSDGDILKLCNRNSKGGLPPEISLHIQDITWDVFLKHGISNVSKSLDSKSIRKLDKWSCQQMTVSSGNAGKKAEDATHTNLNVRVTSIVPNQ